MHKIVTAFSLFFLIACKQTGEVEKMKKTDERLSALASDWSPAVSGLSIRLELPAGPLASGQQVETRLHFRNASQEPVRIYLLASEPFRGIQSMLRIRGAAKGPSFQPPPRPHGYKVTAKDFHLLAPGEQRSFGQTLRLPESATGKLAVEWTYRNEVRAWSGGIQTLDGPTEALFDGEEIPHIWTGELRVSLPIEVGPAA
ncbi:MAG: hypothetical protein JXR96_01345 [Deltaproteobacteria bacterium]|nr:hypothetical protein [Deltaproteobacteria bacterium]